MTIYTISTHDINTIFRKTQFNLTLFIDFYAQIENIDNTKKNRT